MIGRHRRGCQFAVAPGSSAVLVFARATAVDAAVDAAAAAAAVEPMNFHGANSQNNLDSDFRHTTDVSAKVRYLHHLAQVSKSSPLLSLLFASKGRNQFVREFGLLDLPATFISVVVSVCVGGLASGWRLVAVYTTRRQVWSQFE